MGSGLCRTDKGSRAVQRFDGLYYRKIVFNCAKQWTRYSDRPTRSENKNAKHDKSGKKKLIISGPFPADPDRLLGEKWQYVIVTRLDTEPPPERPPRTKRRRRPETASSGVVSGVVRWGSQRRRSFGRRRPPRSRQLQQQQQQQQQKSVHGPPITEPTPSGRIEDDREKGERAAAAVAKNKTSPTSGAAVKKSSLWVALRSGAVVAGRAYAARRNGLLESVVRANAMANDLSSS